MREYSCECDEGHAVVMDVHPLGRWIPESIADVFRTSIEPTDEFDDFGTIHLMGMVLEEYPERVAVDDATDDPDVGYALMWVTSFDSRTLHRIVVELLVELIDHAIGHARDQAVETTFQEQLDEFDIDEFVDQYREQRNFSEDQAFSSG